MRRAPSCGVEARWTRFGKVRCSKCTNMYSRHTTRLRRASNHGLKMQGEKTFNEEDYAQACIDSFL